MSFNPSFPVGRVVSNTELSSEFKCGNMGGMRRSRETNTLVLISDYTKPLYDDKWFKDCLHYTGMGKSGSQSLNYMQNKTLGESQTNGVDVHLFEVFKKGEYTYKGQVDLSGSPYQDKQRGEDGVIRDVWIFPLRLRSGEISINAEVLKSVEIEKEKRARLLSDSELKKRAEDSQSDGASIRPTISNSYIRNAYISEYVKREANGFCQLCGQKAPFSDKNGNPYLESHHIVWLSNGGEDTIANTVALCPNCHRKMHVLNRMKDIEVLKSRHLIKSHK